MNKFKLNKQFAPAGDQPQAIKKLVAGLKKGLKHQTLLGVTGSGKTFTVANIIENIQKPTLIIAHNKTLAAQLAQEYREFFPENAVHYFVSYYDYYQPEAYMPISDTYIEKEAMINEEIDRLRHASTQALLTRKDVIIVASVSCIYGLGSPVEYEKVNMKISVGDKISRADFLRKLIEIHFERTNADLSPGQFRAIGNTVEIMPVSEKNIYRIEINPSTSSGQFASQIEKIQKIDAITRNILEEVEVFFLFPAKHFISNKEQSEKAFKTIKAELNQRLKQLEKEGKNLEAERLKRKTSYDLALIREIGYCNGIENYSRHFSGKKAGEAPDTLLSYFGNDFLTIIDESHVTVPQLGAMYAGDASRKQSLVDYGFRLPSCKDNRPLKFNEFEERVGQVIYTSATPGPYELKKCQTPDMGQIVEQVIRPTGLIDPVVEVRPITATTSPLTLTGSVHSLDFSTKNLNESCECLKSHSHPLLAKGEGEHSLYSDNNSIVPVFPPLDKGRATRSEGWGYPGQIADFINEAEKNIKDGGRVIATTLTKKMAEDLSEYLKEKGIKAEYLHSDIKTIERIEILTNLRKGKFDVLVGVNLLREGLDLPEVTLIGILDADKEGFLRSETSLIQIIGRAARNVKGKVILYADVMTDSMKRALDETNRRREKQKAFNKKHGITPKTIIKKIQDITDQLRSEHDKAVGELVKIDKNILVNNPKRLRKLISDKEKQMSSAVKILDFETAALLRDEILELTKLSKNR